MKLIPVLIIFCGLRLLPAISSTIPLAPTQYQQQIGQGFSTNYFKTLNFKKYHRTNIEDVYDSEFRNLRIRCRADLEGLNMTIFLDNLETVVDDCLDIGISPIISWIHHEAEAYGTEEQRDDYLQWWTDVATQLKDKDYRLSFNLFTELGLDTCKHNCEGSLRVNTQKYNNWTSSVVKKIRKSGGKNDKRIIILGSPKKTASGLAYIDPDIYENDSYMMAEWHIYASGPNKQYLNNGNPSQKHWKGNGNQIGKSNVDSAIQEAIDFTDQYNLETYLGAWMPIDNNFGELEQWEVIRFARYFVEQMRLKKIPWSVNVLDMYYNTRTSEWISDKQNISGQLINMEKVLDEIIIYM